MAKNRNKKQQNDTEFAQEVTAKNVKQAGQNNANEGANQNAKY
ncbi:hypothetical protein [Paenibacillus sp. OAS669]|nr:hypothetical protein [Paenibacillus sp. OAS669]MBE1441522.1 hypothetical protein [Paenibacillus sp. OAS669]